MNNLVKSPAMAIEKNGLIVKYFQLNKDKEIVFETAKVFDDVTTLTDLSNELESFVSGLTSALQLSAKIKEKSGITIDIGIKASRPTYFQVMQGNKQIYQSATFKPTKFLSVPNSEVEIVLSLLLAQNFTSGRTTKIEQADNANRIYNYMKDNADLLEENKQARTELKEERKRLKELETAK